VIPVADLETLANFAEIFGALTIIGGAIFAIVQIREFRARRRLVATVELTRSFQSPDLADAVNLIRGLPDGLSGTELRSKGPECERAAVMISTTYETIGFLVFREMASLSMVRELTGGLAVVLWRKLGGWTEHVRAEQGQPSWAEWFQWLAEQLTREGAQNETEPAYQRYRDWRPRV
jgi:hypothetical protein